MPVNVDEDEIYLHDPKSDYYNDKCCPSKNKDKNSPDIILSDKHKEFVNKNLSVCENNCEFGGYNMGNKQVVCECNIKKEINVNPGYAIDGKKFFSKFKDIKNMMNLYVLKCYKILLTKNGLLNNIGSYKLLGTILFYIFSVFIFVAKGFGYFNAQIKQIMKNKVLYYNNNKNDEKLDIKSKNSLKIKEVKTQIKSKDNGNKTNKKSKSNKESNKEVKKNKKNKSNKAPPKKSNKSNKKEKIKNKSKESSKKLSFSKDRLINNNLKSPLGNVNIQIYNSKDKAIKLNTNNYNNNKKPFMIYNDYELNSLSYLDALKYDKRNYLQYYMSLIKTKHLLIFTFFQHNDYNSTVIKICLFFFSFDLYYTINVLFYTDSTLHDIYEDSGAFKFLYHLPQILYSTVISAFINVIVKNLSLSQKNLLEIKNEKKLKNCPQIIEKNIRCLKIKFTLFYILSFIFLIFFWYYLGCFCAVYKNTQIHLVKDTLFSFGLSLLYPLGINLIPGFFRIPALKATNKNKNCIYGFSKILNYLI